MTGVLRQANAQQPPLTLPPPESMPGEFGGSNFGSALASFVSNTGTFLVVGAPDFYGGTGTVLFFDFDGGTPVMRRRLDAPMMARRFGAAVAVGDFDGDGQPDLVVGAPETPGMMQEALAGAVYVYLGVIDGGVVDATPTMFNDDLSNGLLGSSVAVLTVGTSGYVLAGRPGSNFTLVFPEGAGFGSPYGAGGLAITDLTGDGIPDVLSGYPAIRQVSAEAMVANSSTQVGYIGQPPNDFGTSVVAVDDLNANGWQDLLVGAPNSQSGQPGIAQFFDGQSIVSATDTILATVVATAADTGFGQTIAELGAFNGGDRKFVVGAPNENNGTGAIHLYTMQQFPTLIEVWPGGRSGEALNGQFGSAIVGELDVNGDSFVDFAVGAPGANSGTGEVEIFLGGPPQGCVLTCGDCEACVSGACVPLPDAAMCPDPNKCSSGVCRAGQCMPQPNPCPGGGPCDPNRGCVPLRLFLWDEGSRHGVVGQPYHYNADAGDLLHVTGAVGTPSFFTCDGGPPGFDVDGGHVTWTPQAPGDVSICLGAKDSALSDSFSYTVTVTTLPRARFKVFPPEGPAPLQVTALPENPDPGLEWTWDFGDMSPLGEGATPPHAYLMPGSYPIDVVVTLPQSSQSDAYRQYVAVLDAVGNRPPHAEIHYDAGTFSCEACDGGSAGIAKIVWDFPDGQALGPSVMHPFDAGSYRVRLTVTDDNGLKGFDALMVSIPAGDLEAPKCRLSALPPAGNAPLTVQWSALVPPTPNPPDAPTTPQTYGVGLHRENLLLLSSNGLTCNEFAWATALGEFGDPIAFTNQPQTQLQCGDSFSYTPTFTGSRPVMLSLYGPDGATLQSGTVSWVGSATPGRYPFELLAQNAAGSKVYKFFVDVSCHGIGPLPDGGISRGVLNFQTRACGCDGGGASLLWLAALATLKALSRRR
jgi:PKD repeat protein